MSRTSKTLLRLGVPTLAAATLVGGVPAFVGTAAAAPIGAITIRAVDDRTPVSAAAGACQAFVVEATPATAGASTVGETVNVALFNSLTGDAAADASFCTLPTNELTAANEPRGQAVTPAAGTVVSTGGPNGTQPTNASRTDQSRFVLEQGASGRENIGRVVVGITRNQPGNVDVTVYSDLNGNNTFDVANNEVQAVPTTAAFTAGGENGTNVNQNAAVQVEVINLNENQYNATPTADTDTVVQNEARQFRALVTNSAGDGLEGATVSYQVNAPNAVSSTIFGTTDNNGIVTGNLALGNVGSSTVTFFVNQSNNATTTTALEDGEPRDTTTVTVAQSQPASTIDVVPLADANQGAASETVGTYQTSPAINPRTDGNRTFRVFVDNASANNNTSVGRLVSLTVTGGSGDETVQCATGGSNGGATPASTGTTTNQGAPASRVDCSTSELNGGTPNNAFDSFVDVIVNDPTTRSGEVLTVTGTVRGQAVTDAETLSYVAIPSDARNIDLTPETATTQAGQARTFTAKVTDFRGQPVFNVGVELRETGVGAFRNGETVIFRATDRSGEVNADVTSTTAESGQQTITATIGETAATRQNAGQPFGTTRAGNRTDTSTNTFTATGQPTSGPSTAPTGSPTATPTASASQQPQGARRLGISVSPNTITPGIQSEVRITGTPGSIIELQAYSRPSTDYVVVRRGTINETGVITFRVVPGTNTRLFATVTGVANTESPSVVINVRTALSLTVVRNGSRDYTFQGRILPRRSGQLITLYRVTNTGQEILTSQLKTDSSGTYRIRRVFTGSGTFGFLTRTGQTLTNASGVSNNGQARPTAIYAGPQR